MKTMHRGTWIIIIICAKHLNTYPALHCGLRGFYATTLIQCINIVNLCSKILTDNLLRTRVELHEISTNTHVPPCMNSHTHTRLESWQHHALIHKEKKMCDFGKMEKVLFPPSTPLSPFCLPSLCLPLFSSLIYNRPPPSSSSLHALSSL